MRLLRESIIIGRFLFYRYVVSWILGSFHFNGYCRIYGRLYVQDHPCNIHIGRNVTLGRGLFIAAKYPAEIQIGKNSGINSYCHLVAGERIRIGCSVAIAELVSIRDQEHRFSVDTGVRNQGYTTAPILIEDNCWIGRGAYIGPGTIIRKGSIVAANAVVRGEFPPYSLIAGVPATVKKSLQPNAKQ